MGEADRAGPWFCGPEQDRRAYVVGDIGGIEGGQGLVVRAERRTFDSDPVGYQGPVALKLLTDVGDHRVATLKDRWELLAEIDHPHLARPVEVFQGPGLSRNPDPHPPPEESKDVCYVAAVWAEGSGLREVSPLDPAAAFAIARDVAAGVEALHERELLHRDLHPGNVVVSESGRAVLIDFGAAREADGSFTTTVSGVVGFIAPECVNGPSTVEADRWGVGMLTVFTLLGHPQGTTRLDDLRTELRSALAGIGQRRRAVDLLCQMIDADPDRRPADVVAWAEQLTACLTPVPRRRRLLLPAATATAVAALGSGLVLLARPWEDTTGRPRLATTIAPTCDRSVDAAPSPAGPPGQTGSSSPSGQPAPDRTGSSSPGSQPAPDQTGSSSPGGRPAPDQTGQVDQTGPGDPTAQAGSGGEPTRDQLVAAVERLATDTCLAGSPTTFAQAAVQPLVTATGQPDGVVILAPSGASVRLTEAMWVSYRDVYGVGGRVPPQDQVTLRGYPIEVVHLRDPTGVELRLDRSGMLIGPRDDTEVFWIPGRVLDLWLERGGAGGDLGFPMSNPYRNEAGMHLEFERGTMHAYGDDAEIAEMVAGGPLDVQIELHDPAAARTRSVVNGIVRQRDGTAWWVDARGVRHWIPDETTRACLGGDVGVVLDRARGWEVAALPLGPAATCPDGGGRANRE